MCLWQVAADVIIIESLIYRAPFDPVNTHEIFHFIPLYLSQQMPLFVLTYFVVTILSSQ